MSNDVKVLLAGVSGYIGGSVFSAFAAKESQLPEDTRISVLVRGQDRARVLEDKGFDVELFESLDQSDLLEEIASKYDVVISCVIGFHSASACSFIRGLGRRGRATGHPTYYIHTSGQSNVGDLPMSGKYHERRIFSDKENIYEYETTREALHHYGQRETDIAVVETGMANNVRTTILMPPTIYGLGTGLFNQLSAQIPTMFRAALKYGQAVQVGDHHAVWNHVHIEDLAALYAIVLAKIVKGQHVPFGKEGIVFAEGGTFAWIQMSQGVAKALKKRGEIETEEIRPLTLREAADEFAGGDEYIVEVGFAGNSRVKAEYAREWGWEPKHSNEDFLQTFELEADAVLGGTRELLYAGHVNRK